MTKKAAPAEPVPLRLEMLIKGGRRSLDHLERERPRLERMLWDDAMLSKLPRAKWEATRTAARNALRMHDALRDALHANATANLDARDKQSKRAKAPRVVADDGRTVKDVVRSLSQEHRDAPPREIWPHLRASIEEWTGGCKLVGAATAPSYRYQLNGSDRTLTYRHFAELLRDIRKKSD